MPAFLLVSQCLRPYIRQAGAMQGLSPPCPLCGFQPACGLFATLRGFSRLIQWRKQWTWVVSPRRRRRAAARYISLERLASVRCFVWFFNHFRFAVLLNKILHQIRPGSGRGILQAFGSCINEHALFVLLAVQPLTLFHQDQCRTATERDHQYHQSGKEAGKTVGGDEADDGTAYCPRRPIDIPALNPHEFKGPLQSLEHGVFNRADISVLPGHGLAADAEEQRERLCGGHQEDAGTHNHHDGLLQILLIARNVLIINTNWNGKMTKETN